MGDAEIKASTWRLVEVGRVVLFTGGPFKDRLATIVEIIDHKRVWLVMFEKIREAREADLNPRYSLTALHQTINQLSLVTHLPYQTSF